MKCAWEALIQILPPKIRPEVDRLGKQSLQELRLRTGQPVEMVMFKDSIRLRTNATSEDIDYIVNAASRYSPWASATVSSGYITARGGHRIGLCGEVVKKAEAIVGIRTAYSLCIRVARDLPGISKGAEGLNGNLLILGPPGSGKTTLLRDLIRQKADQGSGAVAVVDERGELFPDAVDKGSRTEVLTGCPKVQGIEMMLRTMGPDILAVDEITAGEDCEALHRAAGCGVDLLATAHAGSLEDFLHREVYRPLVQRNLFDYLVILHPDRHWHLERSRAWTTNGSARS